VCQHIAEVCNFFEELAIGVRSRQINEFIVKEFYQGMLCRVAQFVEPWLPVVRNSPLVERHPFGSVSKPEVYENMFWLHERWSPTYRAKYLDQSASLPLR
jgi:hypothetical protein